MLAALLTFHWNVKKLLSPIIQPIFRCDQAILGEQDEVWVRYRHQHVQEVNQSVQEEVQLFLKENSTAKVQQNMVGRGANVLPVFWTVHGKTILGLSSSYRREYQHMCNYRQRPQRTPCRRFVLFRNTRRRYLGYDCAILSTECLWDCWQPLPALIM